MINSTSMKTLERATLYEKIKNLSIENFDIELKDEDLDEYSLEQLTEINNKLNEIVKYGDERWVVSYSKLTLIDFLKSIFKYDNKSIYYDYSRYSPEEIVRSDLGEIVDDYIIEYLFDCIDIKRYVEDKMYLEEAEYGYIATW